MDTDFWLKKWENNDLGFHVGEANPILVRNFKALALDEGHRLFVPLCGKSLDIAWLLSNGHRVVGAELSQTAIEQLFAGLGIEPTISSLADFRHYSAPGIDIYVGNVFDLSADLLGDVDAIYDRAALVALPKAMRRQYTAHMRTITNSAPQLLVSYVYDQSLLDGPPFSVTNDEVNEHYDDSYQLTLLETLEIAGGLKGKCAATENVWLLQRP